VVEGGSSSSVLTSAPSTAADVEFQIPDASLSTIVEQTSSGDTLLAGDMSSAWPNALPSSTPLPAVDRVALVEACSATLDNAVDLASPESVSYPPLPALDTVAVFEAGSASLDTAVDHANPESAASTSLPVLDPVAVFGAGSATHDSAVDHATPESAASTPAPVPALVADSATHDTDVEEANYDDADFGDLVSEGGCETSETSGTCETSETS
jgi:hypothetical protein